MISCEHIQKNENTISAKTLLNQAISHKKKKNYLKALENLDTLNKNYAYDSRNQQASLLKADIYFEQKDYKNAQTQYKIFQKLYPHKKTNYVNHQLGLVYFFQIPSQPDRDLSVAQLSLDHFKTLSRKKNPYRKQARKYIAKIHNLQAEKSFNAAAFYTKRKWDKAAYYKFQKFLKQYPRNKFTPQALLYSYQLAQKLGKPSKKFKKRLLKEFPKSKEAKLL